MQKKYYKKIYSRDLLEEILNRNRKMLSKRALRNSSRIKQTRNRTNINGRFNNNKVNTIFKSIGHRKNCDSLKISLEYVLRKTPALENELGLIILFETIHFVLKLVSWSLS